MSTEDGGAKAPVDALVMPDLRHIGTRRSGHVAQRSRSRGCGGECPAGRGVTSPAFSQAVRLAWPRGA